MNRIAWLVLLVVAAVMIRQLHEPVRRPAVAKLAPMPQAMSKAHAWERAQWQVQKRLAAGQEHLPMNALEPARVAMQKMARSSAEGRYFQRHPNSTQLNSTQLKSAAAWVSLGPTEKGGRTRRIVFDSNGTQYAAGVSGGVWRLDGNQWTALGDRLTNMNIGALALAPDNDQVIYVGTGELYRRTLRPYSSMTGSGIFKSSNGGGDWVQLQASLTDDFLYVSDIVISPNDSNRIYAATNTGVWRSDDGGVSFEQSLSTREAGGNLFEGCTDLDIRTDLGVDWLLATCASRSTDDRYYLVGLLPTTCIGPCDGRIYLNQDAATGDDWDVVLSESGMGRTSLSVFPGDQNIVYALVASNAPGPDKIGDGVGDYENGLHGVFRSDDGGQTWDATLRNTSNDPVSTWMLSFAWQARSEGNTPYGAGWYNQAIAVDPSNPEVVWVGGMQLYRSDNGGHSFGLTSNYSSDPEVPASSGPTMHPDIHVLTFDASGRLWIGNDGGVWRASNQTAATDLINDGRISVLTGGVNFSPEVSNYTTTQFYHGTVSPDGKLVIGGMQDNGTDVYNLPGFAPESWTTAFGGDGSYSAYNPDGPYYYFSAQGAYIARMDANYQFTYLRNAIFSQVVDPDEFMFITPFVLDWTDRSIIYLGGKRLFRSTTHGDFWERASAQFGTTFRDKTNAIAVSPTRSDWVLIGTGFSIYRQIQSSFSGQTDQLSSTSPRSGWVSSLIFDPSTESIAYATYSSFGGEHVWKSSDGGISFFPIDGEGSGRLPDVPVHSLAVDPANTSHLYIGTDLGVFFTEDGGLNWQIEEAGFGGAIVERVVINRPDDPGTAFLFAFTYGRGVWRVPLAEVDGQPDYLINPDINGLWYDQSEPGHGIQVQLIDNDGTLRVLITWYVFYQGQPMWLIGVADVDRDRVNVPMTVTRGTGFGSEFNGQDVINNDWGTVELVFASDSELSVRWQSNWVDGEAGALSMSHLSRPVPISIPGASVDLCTTGVYWNATQSGHGIIGETIMLNGSPGFAWSWFNYRNGEQMWLVGAANFDGNRVQAEAFVGVEGEFPPLFNSETTRVDPWGTVEFVFTDERNFTLNWSPLNQPEPAGSLDFTQLSTIADSGCQ